MIEMLQQASSYAADVDGLIILVAVLSGFWFFVAQAVFFWLIFRYRAKPGKGSEYVTGREKHLKRWISFPHGLVLVCDIFIIVASINVWYNVKQRLPEADRVVRITGQQWAWTFQHPGIDGELDTEDDIYAVDELHVEVGSLRSLPIHARKSGIRHSKRSTHIQLGDTVRGDSRRRGRDDGALGHPSRGRFDGAPRSPLLERPYPTIASVGECGHRARW